MGYSTFASGGARSPAGSTEAKLTTLKILEYSDELAAAFHDINVEWIGAMFRLEATDREVLENPRRHIIEPGGVIYSIV